MRIEWSEHVYSDLSEILIYYSDIDKEELGYEIINDIFNSAKILLDFPMSGRVGKFNDTRELVNKSFPYITIYRIISHDLIKILTVVHTSRLLPDHL
ncbi:MAG: type II toxin-antitoxin system RelE/ParE family toxin [Deferribacteraceae bacterium]|jgi:toxin ParE1/3/4|nr:type II toxin-antitoxin system RelE/ParE family toxin [Deferribacteraceae bacterium]